MLQYILTALAGMAAGILAMRVWMARKGEPAAGDADAGAEVAAPSAKSGPKLRGLSATGMLAAAGVLLALAFVAVLLRPGESDTIGASGAAVPAKAADGPAAGKNLDDVDTMISRLSQRLKANPNDGEGFRMLGWSYVMTGRPQLAIDPYKRALALQPDRAVVHAGYGEALVGVAGNTVTAAAKAAFDKAIALDRTEPRARYFLALWKVQNGQVKVGLDEMVALANAGPADAPWQADVRRQIKETAAGAGIDVGSRLKDAAPAQAAGLLPPPLDSSTVAAAGRLPASDRQAMVDTMVDTLAGKLKADPGNVDGWVMLLRSRMVLDQKDLAAGDLAAARRALAGDRAKLAKLDAAARELRVPGS